MNRSMRHAIFVAVVLCALPLATLPVDAAETPPVATAHGLGGGVGECGVEGQHGPYNFNYASESRAMALEGELFSFLSGTTASTDVQGSYQFCVHTPGGCWTDPAGDEGTGVVYLRVEDDQFKLVLDDIDTAQIAKTIELTGDYITYELIGGSWSATGQSGAMSAVFHPTGGHIHFACYYTSGMVRFTPSDS